MRAFKDQPFDKVWSGLRVQLISAPLINTGEWQAIQGVPQAQTREVTDVVLEYFVPPGQRALQAQIEPNLPWAEDHFLERVSGTPHNPPPSAEYWPYAQRGHEDHTQEGQFSHTYPERFWPKYAALTPEQVKKVKDRLGGFPPIHGLRFPYGDLSDLIEILIDRPYTRQAYLPVWFPEDLNASRQGERVPCTLGYHFLIRRGVTQDELSCRYFIRSCDFLRHFRDDLYMAARLTQFIAGELEQARVESAGGHEEGVLRVRPGYLTMYISSLHIFDADLDSLKKAHDNEMTERLGAGW